MNKMKDYYQPSILDACCGTRMFHFDKNNKNVLHVDIRNGDYSVNSKRAIVRPDIVADFRNMPFEDGSFHLVIFDPPHLLWAGKSGRLGAAYGELDKNTWRADIGAGFKECWRVLKPKGTLIFKWSESQIPLKDVLELAPAQPVIGNRQGKATHWIVFFKESDERS